VVAVVVVVGPRIRNYLEYEEVLKVKIKTTGDSE
jgi:hypothetical protein